MFGFRKIYEKMWKKENEKKEEKVKHTSWNHSKFTFDSIHKNDVMQILK